MQTSSKLVDGDRAPVRTVEQAMDEASLVQRARFGDASAFGLLVRRHQDRVFSVCLRMLGERSAAEDMAQEAFVKAYRSIAGFDGRAALYTWLYRIAVNLCLSEKRRAGGRTARSLDASPDEGRGGADVASADPSPATRASQREEHGMVMAALAELDEEQRAVVVLRDIESLDYGEIAEILGVPTGTVKSRLHRARMALRERLKPLLGGEIG